MKEKSEPAVAAAGSVQLADPGGSALLHSQFSRQGDSGQNEDTQDGLVNDTISVRGFAIKGDNGAVGVVSAGGLRMKRQNGVLQRWTKATPPSVRGDVCGFSSASRRRLVSKVMRIDWEIGSVYFCTLTYHRILTDSDIWRRDLASFRKRLARAYPDAYYGLLWKLEFQKRGACHFHTTLHWRAGRAPDIGAFRSWVSLNWNEIAEPGDMAHLRAGTGTEIARNTHGVDMARLLNYLCKYLTKAQRPVTKEGELVKTGRTWGTWGKIPERILYGLKMSKKAYVVLARRLRRWGRDSWYMSRLTGQWQGLRVLYDGELIGQLLRGLDWEVIPMPEALK